jgi:hypothetical protein
MSQCSNDKDTRIVNIEKPLKFSGFSISFIKRKEWLVPASDQHEYLPASG